MKLPTTKTKEKNCYNLNNELLKELFKNENNWKIVNLKC